MTHNPSPHKLSLKIWKNSFVNVILLSFLLLAAIPSIAQFMPSIEGDTVHDDEYFTEIVDSTLKVSNHAFGAGLNLGYRNYNGNFDRYFSNIADVGISFDYQLNHLFLQLDGRLGFGKTVRTLKFTEDKKWEKDKGAYSSTFNLNAGYVAFEDKSTRFIPYMGAGVDMLDSKIYITSEISDYEPNLPYINFGVLFDLKSVNFDNHNKHTRINNKDTYYTGLRISLGMQTPMGKPDFPQYYEGFMFYMTVGLGILSRKLKYK